jgi:prepilin-type N-terminal cleavage/methylation domain-containing protein
MPRPASREVSDPAGFTLIEVLAAILLTSIVLSVAVGFYLNLSNASTTAVETMREQLHATAVLERITRDLSGATLLTAAEDTDPLSHPWYFASASQHAFGGADALKFISRSQRPKVSAYHVSDLAQVAYFTMQEEDGTLTLFRWTAPSLPLRYDPVFPSAEDPRSFVLAEGLHSILFRFRTEEGEWVDEWDSTQLVRSGKLPTAVEVAISTAPAPGDADLLLDEEPPAFVRMIVLHQRPLDLAQMVEDELQARQAALAGGGSAADEDGEVELDEDGNPIVPDTASSMTPAQCVAKNMAACQATFGPDNCKVWSNINSIKMADLGVAVPPSWGCY